MKKHFEKIASFYQRYERHISSLALVGGFVFDAITLKRVDLFLENFWVVMHLVVAAVGIIALNFIEQEKSATGTKEKNEVMTLHFWLIFIVQFAFGGLLSTFLVFYFRSATSSTAWPFLLLLAIIFIANEVFKKHYSRLYFQIGMLFVSIFSFMIYIVPVITHTISTNMFILSGALSVLILWLYLICLRFITREKLRQERWILISGIIAIYAAINILYFTHTIPPLPLSLKDAGVYHSITKDADGNYEAVSESKNWSDYFSFNDPVYNEVVGQPVYAYSAVFLPTEFNLNIVHVWQYYDGTKKRWITENKIVLPVSGGRDGGYRTYTEKTNLVSGLWRVSVETMSGQYIGRIQFNVQISTDTPALSTVQL